MRTKANLTLAVVALIGASLLAAVYAGRSGVSDTIREKPTNTSHASSQSHEPSQQATPTENVSLEKATFGSGCFWCTEAIFQQLKGVHSVMSGYSGGRVANPSYEQVCSGTTGHAEVVQITFDPAAVSYTELLEVFWRTHDPTTLNRQGNDVGTQYRSVIFYHNDEQRKLAEHYKKQLDASGSFDRPIVTEIVPFGEFYSAEGYHQNYYRLNPRQPYCQVVIVPKVEKFKKVFKEKLKTP